MQFIDTLLSNNDPPSSYLFPDIKVQFSSTITATYSSTSSTPMTAYHQHQTVVTVPANKPTKSLLSTPTNFHILGYKGSSDAANSREQKQVEKHFRSNNLKDKVVYTFIGKLQSLMNNIADNTFEVKILISGLEAQKLYGQVLVILKSLKPAQMSTVQLRIQVRTKSTNKDDRLTIRTNNQIRDLSQPHGTVASWIRLSS